MYMHTETQKVRKPEAHAEPQEAARAGNVGNPAHFLCLSEPLAVRLLWIFFIGQMYTGKPHKVFDLLVQTRILVVRLRRDGLWSCRFIFTNLGVTGVHWLFFLLGFWQNMHCFFVVNICVTNSVAGRQLLQNLCCSSGECITLYALCFVNMNWIFPKYILSCRNDTVLKNSEFKWSNIHTLINMLMIARLLLA